MPRRIELKSVAAGVLSTYLSRNNDLNGYWALGVLYRQAIATPTRSIEIFLVGQQAPNTEYINFQQAKYRSLLLSRLDALGIPSVWVQTATLSVQFECSEGPPSVLAISERPFRATLTVITDQGRRFSVLAFGSCWPHDESRESCSRRGAEHVLAS
jgi:hypothetical protein